MNDKLLKNKKTLYTWTII